MESKKLEKPRKNGAFSTLQAVMKPDEETGGVFPTMKPLGSGDRREEKAAAAAPAAVPMSAEAVTEPVDFSKVGIRAAGPRSMVDFETFAKSDLPGREGQGLCTAVPKSKKLLKFVLDDGTGRGPCDPERHPRAPMSRRSWWGHDPRSPILPTCRPGR